MNRILQCTVRASKVLAAMLAMVVAAPAVAASCSATSIWGSMGPPGYREFGNSFSSQGTYLDCYSLSLTGGANSFGGMMEIDPWLNKLDIDVTKVSLYAGGLSGSNTTGSLITWDDSPGQFGFGLLGAGTYTLAVSTTVSRDLGLFSDPVRYTGTIQTTVAGKVPEPSTLALLAIGLLCGVGIARARRTDL